MILCIFADEKKIQKFKIPNLSPFGGGRGRFKIQDSRFKIQDSRFKVQDSRFKVQDSRFKVQDSRFKIQGSRFKVQDSRFNNPVRDEIWVEKIYLWKRKN